jgi:hypothetical protein
MSDLSSQIDVMKAIALGPYGAESPTVEGIARHVAAASSKPPADAINDWALEHVMYAPDPCSEMIVSPEAILEIIYKSARWYGDAPEIAVLVAAMGRSIGMDAQFVAVAFDGRPVSYVFARLKAAGEQWPADPIAGRVFASRVTASTVFPV